MIIIILQEGAPCSSILLPCVSCGWCFLSLGLAILADLVAFMVFRLLDYIAVLFATLRFLSIFCYLFFVATRDARDEKKSKKSVLTDECVLWLVML